VTLTAIPGCSSSKQADNVRGITTPLIIPRRYVFCTMVSLFDVVAGVLVLILSAHLIRAKLFLRVMSADFHSRPWAS
jgi:hypothetical protein